MKDLRGRTVLITGGAQGFGKAIAIRFGRKGAKLVLVDVNENSLRETTGELRSMGFEVHPVVADLRTRQEAERVVDEAIEDSGGIDILINNAGIACVNTLLDLTEVEINDTISINLMAPIWMIRRIIPHMVRRGSGHIVNMGSLGAWVSSPGISLYSAAKSGLVPFTDAVSQELRGTGVKTTLVHPNYAESGGMFEGAKRPRLMRLVTAEEVADTVVRGVEKERAEMYVPHIPCWNHAAAVMRTLFLPKFSYFVSRIVGGTRSLDSCMGRSSQATIE